MNITTPIDDQDLRAAMPGCEARLVDGALPVLVVDAAEATIVAANPAAMEFLGLGNGMPCKLDRTMPAWAAIHAQVARTSKHPSPSEPLLFWTPTGPCVFMGTLETVAGKTGTLVRIVLRDGRANAAGASAPAPGATAGNAQAGDLATLREIARRIRAGTAAMTTDTTKESPMPVSRQPPVPKAPPQLDFKPMNFAAIEAASATEPRGQTLAKLAHELRTPLSAIVSLAEIMRDERLGTMANPRYKAYAADIHDSARHTLDLVGAMLDGDHGVADGDSIAVKPKFNFDAVDLGEIAARCVSAMQPIGARGGVSLVVEAAPDLPALLADRRALRQIILNVLSNALRFTPKGGRITLSTGLTANGEMELSATDTGTGMRKSDIDRALGKNATEAAPRRIRLAGERSGFGFGLPLVRELAEAHGGRLAIDSAPGKGTRVTVTFTADHVL